MMGKGERLVIAVLLCLTCPLSLFVAAVAGGFLLSVPERAVTYSAFAGLAAGALLAAVLLKRWVPKFYSMGRALTVPAFVLWSAVVVCVFMGVPIGNLVVGLLAGLYVGRAGHHAGADPERFARSARNVGLFTAAVMGAIALAMGLLAIDEQETMQALLALVGLGDLAATTAGRTALVAVAVPVLAALQYTLTRAAALWGFRLGTHHADGAPA